MPGGRDDLREIKALLDRLEGVDAASPGPIKVGSVYVPLRQRVLAEIRIGLFDLLAVGAASDAQIYRLAARTKRLQDRVAARRGTES